MSTPRRKSLRRIACPQCGEVGLKRIIYGMPDPENFDFEKYFVGGCIPDVADVACPQCKWTGLRDELAIT
jgi:DNA-directed RNA polymerase subunit RPC12/RpoP